LAAARKILLVSALAACSGLAACATSGPRAGTAGIAPVNPPLPETVSAVPNPGDAEVARRSLAAEMDASGKAAATAYVAQPTAGVAAAAVLTAAGQPEFPAAPAPPEVSQEGVVAALVETPKTVVAAVAELPQAAAEVTAETISAVSALPQRFMRSADEVDHSPPAPAGRLGPAGGVEARSPELDQLMKTYADYYGVPESLVRRVAKRESTFDPKARNGIYLGLMQIAPATARGMGYRGAPNGLLDAETNLKYAVRYLRGAFVVAKGNHDKADKLYQTGYYYHAKRMGLLDETGVGVDRKRRRSSI